jgi:hypothetical protein
VDEHARLHALGIAHAHHGHGDVGHAHAHDDHGHAHGHAHDDHGHARDAKSTRRANGAAGKAFPRTASRELETRLESSEVESHRDALEPGAARGKTLFFDAFSGIAGDMTIAALVDLGVPFHVVSHAVGALCLPGTEVVIERAAAGAIGATRFDVRVGKQQPERSYSEIDALLAKSKLDRDVKTLSRTIFERLGRAEAHVHRIALADVHFHEVGAVDAIADIVGAAACFVHLGATDVVVAPLPLGRGFVDCRHGVLPLPAPATVECLRGVPTYDAGIDAELVTPTGAAIIATLARRFEAWPRFSPERVGWGAGTKRLPDRPNALRVVLGSPESTTTTASSHVVIESNVDDMTGELAGHALAALMGAGALDAWAAPVTMKKGRPGLVISVLALRDHAERLAAELLAQTSSIGVRFTPVDRLERPRSVVTVDTRFGPISVKISDGPYGAPVVKPEFDDCAAAAARAQIPVRVVIAEALAIASQASSR